MTGPLKNARHERFCQEYLTCGDAFEAAARAGLEWAGALTGFYVYFLIDGRDGSIFYVGKGSGKRAFRHRREAASPDSVNQVKAQRILDCGPHLYEMVFADALDEPAAFALERDLIHRFRGRGLTNIASGHVHPLESLLIRIDRDIASIKPYSVWIADAHPRWIEAATQLNGSPDEFYVQFVLRFRELRSTVAAELNSIKEKSNGTARR